MKQTMKGKHNVFLLLFIIFFIFFYPMLISIYVFLPLFIGAMSYILLQGLERKKPTYILIAIIFLLNLEINLSLPLFLSIITAFIFYVTLYPSLLHFRRCKLCKPLLSVLILNFLYLGSLFAFDFIFHLDSVTLDSIALDSILFYSLIVDLLVVVLL